MGAMHMSLLGPEGLKLLAQRNMAACQLAKEKIVKIPGISLPHESGYHYNEFAIELPGSASDCLEYLDSRGVIGGLDLSNWYPDKTNWMLVSVSDQTTSNDIEMLCARISIWCESETKGVKA